MAALLAGLLLPSIQDARGATAAAAAGKEIFSSTFHNDVAKPWRIVGGKWEVRDECLRQMDAKTDDPNKAVLVLGEAEDLSTGVIIAAKLRVDSWNNGEWARAGISCCSDPQSGHGLNLVFSRGQLQFMHDYVTWGPGCAFPCQSGQWYWMKLEKTAVALKGKAWPDGHPEPADWMVTWKQYDHELSGYPALVGCSGHVGAGAAGVSFAQCKVQTLGPSVSACYARKATWQETMAASVEALARQEAELAAKSPGGESKAGGSKRDGLWTLLRRDFSDPESRRQMAWERQDNLWAQDWPFGTVGALAQRYAAATRAPLTGRARQQAASAARAADLEAVRKLYYRSRHIDDAVRRWKDANLQSLRLAVEDLVQTHGARYPKGPEYLRRIAEIQTAVADARKPGDQAADLERFADAVERFEALRTEALLANPLLDFDRLLLVKRKDAREIKPRPPLRMPFPNDPIGHLNGLPVNFQSTGVLRQIAFDNEIAVLSPVRPDGRLATLYRPQSPVYVGDLKLHFDAAKLLFSSIGSHDRFQIFEIGVDGAKLRQVTRGEEDDVDNYDACYLPDGRIVFGSSSCFQSVPCERRLDEVAVLHVMHSDGCGVRRVCFDQDHNFYPTMMDDGRILYTRWEYADIAHAFSARLFTMNPDGTQQKAYYASSGYWPNRIFYAKPVPGHATRFLGVISGHHGTARAGELVLFDVAQGRRQAEGVVQRIPGRGRKVEPVMVDGLVDGSWPKFLHPYPLSDKYFLASCQPAPQSRWGIYLVDVFDNMLLLHEEEGGVLFEPVPLRQTPRPRVIPDRVDLASREASVYLLDVYAGGGLQGVPRGTVKKLRLFTYHFNYYGTSGIEDYIGMDGPWDVRRVLGTVPVAEDGSAYFIVPANTPIAVQPLDAEGKALQLMRSWFTAMPGERVSCVGCHEDANRAPPARAGALAGAPSRIAPWHGPVRGFSWDREVQPVLDRYCVGCHDGREPAGGKTPPDLRRAAPRKMPASDAPFPPSFYALRRFVRSPGLEGDPRMLPVADYHADCSPLVKMLRKGHHNVQLNDEAWDRVVTWIDMNAPAYGTWLEIPTACNNPTARQCHDRRIESLRRYGRVEGDPEAVPAAKGQPVTPVMPPPEKATEAVQLARWPFSADEAARRQAGAGAATRLDVELAAGIKLQLLLIPAGEFLMGDGAGYPDEKPVCKVKIERPFWMGKCEVTNEQYACFDAGHQSGDQGKLWLRWSRGDFQPLNEPRQPVCRVSCDEAGAFCAWLSQRTGRRFTLPTEAQWEWACRAGTDTPLNYGPLGADSSAFANLADASLLRLCQGMEKVRPFLAVDPVDDKHTVSAPVGSYRANAWGLSDMHGNVAEWTASAYLPYPFRADDPRHAARDVRKAVRGGSWYDRADLARSGCRTSYWPWQRVFDVGFRVVCEESAPHPQIQPRVAGLAGSEAAGTITGSAARAVKVIRRSASAGAD
jgi:formylglycine-generating enzyme required for sulfatase activity